MRVGHRPSTGPGACCRTCNRAIVWAETDLGRKMPVDTIPSPERTGNLVLWFEVNEAGWPVGKQRVSYATDEQRADPSVPLWTSHFATCPRAAAHRRTA